MAKTFHEFYECMGFTKYPFRYRTAEKEDTSALFVAPPDYSVLKDVFDSAGTAIISGNRGTGKTIILFDIKSQASTKMIETYIDNYETIPLTGNLLDFYSLILQRIITEVLICLSKRKGILKKLSKDEKIFLSFLIMKYADSFTNSEVVSRIENVQLNGIKKFINRISRPLAALLNYGTTAIANFGSDFLNKQLGGYLPPVNAGEIRKTFPDIQFNVVNDFKSVSVSYSLLERALKLIKKISGDSPIVILDKFDEDIRLENDADLIAEFIKELLCDSNLLLNKDIQLFISVWEIPFQNLTTIFRQSKHTVFKVCWSMPELENVLNRRLSVYSDNRVRNYKNLFSDDVSVELIEQMFMLSNMNPRDLWAIFDSIFIEQHKLNGECKILSVEAIKKGMVNFVKNFSFYEYYPRNKDARKNTNDVFSYINHLLKLSDTDEFTNEELREAASTGGSTFNYITAMVSMGLVKKTDNKKPGGAVIYRVNDPKISFAIYEKIDISH